MSSESPTTAPAAQAPAARGLRGFGSRTFYSLGKYPDFRMLWLGNVGTMLAQWVQLVAQAWLVFQLTNSSFQLGAIAFVRGATTLTVSPFAGAVTDRFSRKNVLVLMTGISSITGTALAILVLTHSIEVWMLYMTATVDGLAESVNQPARQVMIFDVVGSEDLSNGVAVNSLGASTMRIIGPALGGALIGIAGVGAAFVLQAGAYLFSSVATSRIQAKGVTSGLKSASVLESMGEGIAYARRHPDVRLLIIMAGLPSVLVYPYVSFLPVFASDVLHVGSTGYGFIASAVGYGSIVGAVLAANFSSARKRGRILVWTTFIYMSLVTLFAASTVFAISFALLVVAGIANSVYLMFIQVMLQLTVTDEYRGRVMSLYVMLNGITPFSALLMGTLIDQFGPQITVACFTGLAAGIVLVIGIFSQRLREI
ncbi:MAG TPA: MFS transporter [Dehalococcoidia bacterium]|nr:MFS transporter [Dehalococcoidia bacterium]